jgi:hypothetical protein
MASRSAWAPVRSCCIRSLACAYRLAAAWSQGCLIEAEPEVLLGRPQVTLLLPPGGNSKGTTAGASGGAAAVSGNGANGRCADGGIGNGTIAAGGDEYGGGDYTAGSYAGGGYTSDSYTGGGYAAGSSAEAQVVCCSEELQSEGYRPMGWAQPQRCVPQRALEGAARVRYTSKCNETFIDLL